MTITEYNQWESSSALSNSQNMVLNSDSGGGALGWLTSLDPFNKTKRRSSGGYNIQGCIM